MSAWRMLPTRLYEAGYGKDRLSRDAVVPSVWHYLGAESPGFQALRDGRKDVVRWLFMRNPDAGAAILGALGMLDQRQQVEREARDHCGPAVTPVVRTAQGEYTVQQLPEIPESGALLVEKQSGQPLIESPKWLPASLITPSCLLRQQCRVRSNERPQINPFRTWIRTFAPSHGRQGRSSVGNLRNLQWIARQSCSPASARTLLS